MSEEINYGRRRFVGTAAMTIAAAQLSAHDDFPNSRRFVTS
jgi:hypothetical protein